MTTDILQTVDRRCTSRLTFRCNVQPNENEGPLILLGGLTTKAAMDLAMREGFEFVAMAPALLRDHQLLN
ncbi:hypothetical protein MCHIJ_14420 [Mycolicibacterium chitae]|uniref:hypothetical protein n=1 Tax=Mycolicibacterium TaxID=1866885 RepID=UPI00138C925A|nr:hypothetical protein MCHIJ_14420 [Mycolicibacterium chitae]